MNQIQRRNFILNKLQKNGNVVINQLSEELKVSSMTIRRDLKAMEQENLLILTRSGAIINRNALVDISRNVKNNSPHKFDSSLSSSQTTDWKWPSIDQLLIGFCEADMSCAYRSIESNNQEEVAKARGYQMITVNSEGDPEKQIFDIKSLISKGCNVIIVVPIDANAILPALALCRERKIPVIIKNRGCNGIPGVDYSTYIASNFWAQGNLCAEWVHKKCVEKGIETIKIAEIQGIAGGTDVRDRSGGFHEVADKYGNFEFVAQKSANWSRSEAKEIASDILRNSKEQINVFYCHNDEMALGVQTAIEAAGLKINEDIYLIGIDGMAEALDAISEGRMSCTVTNSPNTADLNFDIMEAAINGETPATYIPVEDVLIDSDNYVEEKTRLASFCTNFITEGSSICLDTGTTAYAVAEQLKEHQNITVSTQSLSIMQLLASSSVQLISIPGIYHKVSDAFLGQISYTFIKDYQYDILFLTAKGIDAEFGISVPDVLEAENKKALIESAKKVIAVIDKGKLGQRFFSKVAPLSKIDVLVTNEGADPDIINQIKEAGIDVYLN